MDEKIKRAIILTFIIVGVAKLSSAAFDFWMGDTQEDMIENQRIFEAHQRGLAQAENQNRAWAGRQARCRKMLAAKPCLRPKDFYEAGSCLIALDATQCDQLPDLQLCAAVEELQECSDEFADQQKNGCNKLRRKANCKHKPAPADREGLWEIEFDDGLWHGE